MIGIYNSHHRHLMEVLLGGIASLDAACERHDVFVDHRGVEA